VKQELKEGDQEKEIEAEEQKKTQLNNNEIMKLKTPLHKL
jgi:hypothetical protein